MNRLRVSLTPASLCIALFITLGVLLFRVPATARADSACLQYGSFNHSVAFIEAQARGYFQQEGLSVCYNQVTSSTQQFNSLLSGQYNIISTTADNAVNRYVNSQLPVQIVAGSDQGAGLDLFINTANGIHSISDLKGKSVAVDAPNSGYVYALEKILSANGLSLANNDYSLQIVGGTQQRYAAITAGQTTSGDPVYATLLATPFTEQAVNNPNVKDVAQFSSYLAPYQGSSIVVTQAYAQANPQTVTNFLTATIKGNLYAENPANKNTVIADIASVDGVSTAVATVVYKDALRDLVRGENVAELLNTCGVVNAINLRQQFGGFTTTVDANALVKPGKNALYDDEYWKSAFKQALS
jgi:ABC-type nitrate/sulfonate/bicarbonate transport system substrate-binding protein